MKYFVTGATGFVGSHVVRELVAQKHQVVVSVRTPEKAKELAELGVEITQGDVMDKESLRAAMQGVDGVFHIAGWYKIGTKDKSTGAAINIEGTRNVLSLMQDLEPIRITLQREKKSSHKQNEEKPDSSQAFYPIGPTDGESGSSRNVLVPPPNDEP